MTPEEIIKKGSKAIGNDPDKNWRAVDALVKHKVGKIIQQGNSVLFLHAIPKHPYYFACHFYSVASPTEVKTNGIELLKDIKKMHAIKRVYGNTKDNKIIKLLRLVGVTVNKSDLPEYTWMTEF